MKFLEMLILIRTARERPKKQPREYQGIAAKTSANEIKL